MVGFGEKTMANVSVPDEKRLLAIAALVAAAFIGAIMGVFARELAKDLNVVEQVALRSFMGAFILYAVRHRSISTARFVEAPRSDIWLTVFRSVLMFVIAISLGTVAFVYGNYASVAVVMSLPAPALLGVALFGERISFREGMLVTLAFLGAIVVVVSGSGMSLALEWPLVCAVGATFCMASGIMIRRWQTPFLNASETNFLMLVVSALVMGLASAIWMVAVGRLPVVSSYTILVGAIAGCANIGFLLFTHYGVPRLKGVVVNNLLALQPAFGALVGYAVFTETPHAWGWLGCGLILTAVILIANPREVQGRA